MPRFLRPLLPCAGLAAAAMILTSSAPAHAASGDGAAAIIMIALFDIISLPGDIYMAAEHRPVPKDWAMGETIGGGLQMTAGAVGIGYCVGDTKCKNGAGLPALIGFTAWTTAMTFHGVFSLSSSSHSSVALGPRATPLAPSSLSIAPIVGDGRTSPAGLGLVGSF